MCFTPQFARQMVLQGTISWRFIVPVNFAGVFSQVPETWKKHGNSGMCPLTSICQELVLFFFLLVRCLNTKFVGFLMIARRPHKKWYVNDMFSLGNAWSVQYAIMAEVGEPAKLRCHSPNNARVGGLRYGEIYNYIHPIFHLCAYISCSFIFYSMQLGT